MFSAAGTSFCRYLLLPGQGFPSLPPLSPALTHVPKCHSYRGFFSHLQGWGLHHEPGQDGVNPFSEEFFPNTQPKLPLVQLEAISSHPVIYYLGEKIDSLGYNCLSSNFRETCYREWDSLPVPPFLRLNPPVPSGTVWARRQWSPFTELQPSWILPCSENKATTKLLFLKNYRLIWAASQPKVNVPFFGVTAMLQLPGKCDGH